ncbi:hypothetical protein KIK84_07700 [Curvibacter sp. CHRR-16]|uniref:hypothetical protein n=1 Tax=Curvibacter sp. CHRR-16 TaxID=2835872 RepID=UPI001BDA8B73|nr:hypothetical protein [Curvibacter sp. CHRR-16]MBT0570205.1 hypothetical protein [Curvibacter sp. CHRR-16]
MFYTLLFADSELASITPQAGSVLVRFAVAAVRQHSMAAPQDGFVQGVELLLHGVHSQ